MNRRALFRTLALGTLAAPGIARAQPVGKVYRIGILSVSAAPDLVGPRPRSASMTALLEGLSKLGYVYGRNFVTEVRGGDGKPELFPGLATELVGLQLDVILASGPTLPALKRATSTVPVIMTATLDPVQQGFVQSLGHPGTNFTGFSLQSSETVGKRLELLKELARGAPVAVLWDRFSRLTWQAAEVAARERGWKLLSLEIKGADDIDGAFGAAVRARAGSLLASAAGILFPNRRQVAEVAAKHGLPTMF